MAEMIEKSKDKSFKKENHFNLFINLFQEKKGQLFSLDLFISLLAFLLVIAFLLALWNLYSLRLQENVQNDELQLLSFQITDILTKTGGIPENWEKNPPSAQVLGLIRSPSHLDEEKVNAFLAMDYNTTKKLFNIKKLDYAFRVMDQQGKILQSSGLALDQSNLYQKQVVSLNRFALLENQTRQISFTLWSK